MRHLDYFRFTYRSDHKLGTCLNNDLAVFASMTEPTPGISPSIWNNLLISSKALGVPMVISIALIRLGEEPLLIQK